MADFLDNFNGTGTLATHASDSAHAYSDISGTYDAADMKLDGSGALYSSPGVFGGVVTSFEVPEFYTLEIVMEVGSFSGSNYANFVLDVADSYRTSVQVRQSGGATQMNVSVRSTGGGSVGFGWTTITPGVHTFTVSRQNNAEGYIWLTLDGVADWFDMAPQLSDKLLKFYLEMTGGSLFKVRSLAITETASASAFWTANVAATEVFS